MLVGVISDTHGLLRPEAFTSLAEAEHILHAGDVGDYSILDRLGTIAPVTAIRGNIDTSGPCRLFYLVHSVHDLDLNPVAAQVSVVVSGHSHKSSVERKGDVLYLNPGSAGPRRFTYPSTVALVTIAAASIEARIVNL